MTGRRLAFIGAGLVAAACVERLQAPGHCPDFCPSGQVTISDTLLTTNIYGDSAFRGYVLAHQSTVMLAALLPGFPPSLSDTLDGRPIPHGPVSVTGVLLSPSMREALKLTPASLLDSGIRP